MNDELEKRILAAVNDPRNRGELADADAAGSVGNAGCGDMLRVWVKFKEENGRKVIDKATFQAFGCETAIAAASLAMEVIRGKTPEEALKLSGEDFAQDLGPLPPTKVHCTQLVEAALRSALEPASSQSRDPVPPKSTSVGNLDESLSRPPGQRVRVVLLKNDPPPK